MRTESGEKDRAMKSGCDAISTDGGPVCGEPFELVGDGSTCEYRCRRGHLRSELYLAASRLGPFAPMRTEQEQPEPIPGFIWDAKEQCHVRIKSDEQIAKEVADDMRRWHAKGRPGW